MCGVAGAICWNERVSPEAIESAVARMTAALAHRGPDGSGVMLCASPRRRTGDPSVVLGHRRLSIIDLSARAAQPMTSEQRPITLTFNGEIYNFQTLRRELATEGVSFRSDSDTEVILRGYERWGPSVVDRLQGMFAFALWNGDRRELLLARDRLGIKPLYVYWQPGLVLFASEVRALLASALVPRVVEPEAIDHFLAYQSVVSPLTMVRGVRMVEAGQTVTFGAAGQASERKYWDLLRNRSQLDAQDVSRADATRQVGTLLTEATARHLVSDVPVGLFLSGGIDSGALVSLARESGTAPHTFSVTFPGTPQDESAHARDIADAFGAVHTEIPFEDDVIEAVSDGLAAVDQPSGDGINTYLVCRAVRRAGIKVALSGLGGDELFAGYPSFLRLDQMRAYAGALRASPHPMRRAAAAAVRLAGRSSVSSGKMAALLESGGSLPRAFTVFRQLFSPADRAALQGRPLGDPAGDPYTTLLEEAFANESGTGLMALVSYAELRTYTHDVLLRDTDQMSMSQGLEVRVPLLDHALAEYVVALPDHLKRPNGSPKRLLVESLPTPLPAACVQRRKQGFVLPFDRWMRSSLRGFCETRLTELATDRSGPLRGREIQRIWKSFLTDDGRTTWSRPWALVALSQWLRSNAMELES